jgi:hypothetical protein
VGTFHRDNFDVPLQPGDRQALTGTIGSAPQAAVVSPDHRAKLRRRPGASNNHGCTGLLGRERGLLDTLRVPGHRLRLGGRLRGGSAAEPCSLPVAVEPEPTRAQQAAPPACLRPKFLCLGGPADRVVAVLEASAMAGIDESVDHQQCQMKAKRPMHQ